MNKAARPDEKKIDRTMFAATVATILLLCVPVALAPVRSADLITQAYAAITGRFGILYLLYGIGTLGFLLYLAFGRFGKVVLGGRDDHIEFPTHSWVAMLFCAGVGAGLLYWAVIEWGYYIDAPPFGLEPRSAEAIEWSASYGLYHWGLTAWALYCLPTLAIAYPYYVRKIPYLRLSTACNELLPNGVNSRRGRLIDFLYMLNLIGGTGTSLGLSTPMIAASFARMTGMSHDFLLEVSVVVFCIAIFGTSAWLGLQKGFRRLADINMIVALALLFFVLAVGPTLFILKTGLNSIGLVLQNFVRLSSWTDPVGNSGFVESWTVFYWAWWIAYGPFVGIFVTRISRGRTIRQVIGGMLTFGSLGAAMFFIVLGNYALHLELSGLLPVTSLMKEPGEAAAIAEVFMTLPLGYLALAAFFVVAVVFLATTYDSASYTLASVSTARLEAGENPLRWNRVFWACALGVLPITLMFVDGGLKVVLSATIVVSLPLLLVGVLMAMSLIRSLRADHPR
ncbi:MAG: BCCT family transporter [Gammaproteobacteria bacterium]|nr:BCCT family transporter [Gammaproteobacteria bacterium]